MMISGSSFFRENVFKMEIDFLTRFLAEERPLHTLQSHAKTGSQVTESVLVWLSYNHKLVSCGCLITTSCGHVVVK